jgi:hypothetical protein
MFDGDVSPWLTRDRLELTLGFISNSIWSTDKTWLSRRVWARNALKRTETLSFTKGCCLTLGVMSAVNKSRVTSSAVTVMKNVDDYLFVTRSLTCITLVLICYSIRSTDRRVISRTKFLTMTTDDSSKRRFFSTDSIEGTRSLTAESIFGRHDVRQRLWWWRRRW